MLIRNTKEFLEKTFQKKIICLDIGKSKIGLAISDLDKKISTPLKVIKRDSNFFSDLKKILIDFEISGILIGLPLNNDLSKNRMCHFIEDISKNLDTFLKKNKYELPIFFWDESYTSIEAEDLTKNLFKNQKKQKKEIDKYAANIILKDFISNIE